MRPIETWRVLPHEMAFGVFLAATFARLVPTLGLASAVTWLYLGLVVIALGLVFWVGKDSGDLRWRLRLGFYPLAMNAAYFTLGTAIPAFHPGKEDAWLQHLDTLIIGGNASLWMQRMIHPALSDILSACYLFFFPGLLLSWLHYFRRELPVLRAFVIGQFTVYGLGFLGYSFMPALGPYLDPVLAQQFTTPITGGWITRFNERVVISGSNKVDVFPSLHCGITLFILLFHRVHAPNQFRWVLLPTIGLWVATLYLRYHYFVDLLAGFALAAFALILVCGKPKTRFS